ncbi:MAG: GspE family T2SS ATPase variant XcpR [Wenzhouxiangellaceae bacterium]
MSAEFRPAFGFARRRGVTVAGRDTDGRIRVLVREPADLDAVREVRRHLDGEVVLERLDPDDYLERIASLYQADEAGARLVADGVGEQLDLGRLAEELPPSADLLESEDDAPIIRLLNGILAEAVRERASDIHLEPFEDRLAVRFRVDGLLREVLTTSPLLAPLVASRIKVMARLDIAEKRLPQDGRIGLRLAGRAVDVRVSTLPSQHGERIVLRILDKQAGCLSLEQLGMREQQLAAMRGLVHRPHGIVLVTGPTGSGKSTTLYAALLELNDRSRNILTIEDPVEYDIDGIGQTQVNPKVELDFARGLRAILRQDPDVVMVGEIRDAETARIAVQASMTGHLVLSTLHTNTAIGAVSRLVDMGIEAFLLSGSLTGLIAQRLLRRLDPTRCEPYELGRDELESLGLSVDTASPVRLHRPRSDLDDPNAAYAGRIGIFEVNAVGNELRRAIHDRVGEAELERIARQASPSLIEDGWARVCEGLTSLDELLRVARED